MGSAKVTDSKPQLIMENKLAKRFSILKSLFNSKKKEKPKIEDTKSDYHENKVTKQNDAVASVIATFKNLDLKDTKGRKEINDRKSEVKDQKNEIHDQPEVSDQNDEDELNNFAFKVIEDDRKRVASNSSDDSGYSEKSEEPEKDDLKNDLIEQFDKIQIDTGKKLQTVKVGRGIWPKTGVNRCPYRHPQDNLREINQINKQTLTGGQVIVNTDNFSEVDIALKQVEIISQNSQTESDYWTDVLELIEEETKVENPEVTLPVFEESFDFNSSIIEHVASMFPTPPHSENMPSPMSESQTSFYPNHSDYTLSPERSSPYNSDFEKYQDIQELSFEDLSNEKSVNLNTFDKTSPILASPTLASPTLSSQTLASPTLSSPTLASPITEEKQQEKSHTASLQRNGSLTSMTLKNFKDLQKEIAHGFTKKECCELNRKPLKDIFDENMQKLKMVDRKNLCLKVSKMDLKTAYGVLQHILMSLSRSTDQEEMQTVLFFLICQRILAQRPALFTADFGLNVLKSAVMRCPHRPVLARCVVHYVYTAIRTEPTAANNESVFHEVDALGDNLVIACARGGDSYALVLAEITRNDERGQLPPLFRLNHVNSDGQTALHVACNQHSVQSSRLHTVHVLLDHAGADIWKGDVKGGDTPLHLAVNSTNCDLHLILMLFKNIDRKLWKKLAHYQNMSSVTPLEYARSATRSTTRENYPTEVLSFLMKCR